MTRWLTIYLRSQCWSRLKRWGMYHNHFSVVLRNQQKMILRRKRKNKGSSRIKPTNWKLTMESGFWRLSCYSLIKDLSWDHFLKSTSLSLKTLPWHQRSPTPSSSITQTKLSAFTQIATQPLSKKNTRCSKDFQSSILQLHDLSSSTIVLARLVSNSRKNKKMNSPMSSASSMFPIWLAARGHSLRDLNS